ncbi:MAG: SurA N-terminal domain-containing protein [Hyphomicrobium sp.]|uniref:SurA N-terminal domain-containing protein n=1 Tax=Hyphomicrobium sp. TaxID=82 RepID=UPI0013281C68|nr:SurA N-terminal domain-containing protein [Hyphomicrobium sp.]KAB2937676.1 MAG: peptidylprolyl isomerase [Hyphomicrobium sp.]MBZ0211461.1 SurA N-terminal domain-containing protein [Hyphomicrobium sp.]MCZ7596019.1 SurA N-terminal domain-containing protein [Hyphomicrobium sp.]
MLDALRRGSTGLVAKVLFALLVLSFAIWGVADVFTGWGRGALAKIGSQEIRLEEYQRAFQNEINLISQQAGRRITTEQAHAAGLDNRVLAQLIAWSAVEQHADELNLALSDTSLAEAMKNDQAFKGPDGKFNRLAFENVLDRLGVSERGFLQLRRRDELREQLTSALINGVAVPDAMIEVLNAWKNETRVAEHFTIDADKAVTVPEPDEAKLKATYEANKANFMAPEFRKLALLVLSIDNVKKTMEVSDAEAQTSYEETKKDYNTPERRRVQQIAFKDKAAAEVAKKAIADGKSFGDAAKDAGAKDSDIDLGLISKDRLIDPKIADAVFSLPKDTVSDPIEGRFATVLVRVTDIQPAVDRTFADVKNEVKDKLATKKAAAQMQTLLDQVEDQRSAGKSLKEIGEAMKLQFYEIPEADRSNKDRQGKPAILIRDPAAVLNVAFGSGVGIENDVVEVGGDSYAWVDVLDVMAEKQKPFDEVKDAVKQFFIKQERERLVSELAGKLVERADNGEAMSVLATAGGAAKVATTPPFNRTTEPQGMSRDAVARAFTLAKGKAGSAPDSNNKSRIVFKVTEITPAPAVSEAQRNTIASELKNQLADETLSEYVLALQKSLGTHIYEDEFKKATGAASGDETQ